VAERAGAARWEPAILLAVATDVLLEIQVVEVVMFALVPGPCRGEPADL